MVRRKNFIMSISDRFTRGWIAGACGGLVGGISGFLPNYIGISSMRLSDWSAILIFGREQFSLVDQIYATFVLAGSMGVIGIIFALLSPCLLKKISILKDL